MKQKKNATGKHPFWTNGWLPYLLGFVLLAVFFGIYYGDVIVRAQQESYVCTDHTAMHYLLGQPLGELYWLGRFALLSCHTPLSGALTLSTVLTLAAWLLDRALCLPLSAPGRRFLGLGFMPSVALAGWMMWRGTNLYYKSEPSLFVIIAIGILILSALLAGISALVRRRWKAKPTAATGKAIPWGMLLCIATFGACYYAAATVAENTVLTARLQNLCMKQEWQQMIEEARKAHRPSRAVAAYHAIALEETDQLLYGMFDLVYDYPKLKLDKHDGNEEFGIFLADCNYHAGLPNPGYRAAMDHIVMNGPRLYHLKRLAVCAIANGEWKLARRHLDFIAKMPLEKEFVEKYGAMADNPELVKEDAELMHVASLAPKESFYEQNYREPVFLGYNVGLNSGSDATLMTSLAACLYSKDLKAALMRINFLKSKGIPLPPIVQQAVVIAGMKDPKVANQFPEISTYMQQQVKTFLYTAKPFSSDRIELRKKLKDEWLGTYMYYYYCENNDPEQVIKETGNGQKAGVN